MALPVVAPVAAAAFHPIGTSLASSGPLQNFYAQVNIYMGGSVATPLPSAALHLVPDSCPPPDLPPSPAAQLLAFEVAEDLSSLSSFSSSVCWVSQI